VIGKNYSFQPAALAAGLTSWSFQNSANSESPGSGWRFLF